MMHRRNFLGAGVSVLAGCAARSVRPALAAPDLAPMPPLRAQRLAWAGVRLQLEKVTVFIDPLLSTDAWGSALSDPIVPLDGATGSRFVLLTHRHPDHFDVTAVRKAIGESGTVICSADTAPAVAARGFKPRIAPLYEPMLLDDDFTASAVPAVDGYGDPQVSWVVRGGGRRIFHGGDTLWHGAWWHIGRQFGPFDAAFLPINGARFAWRKPAVDISSVLTPEQAVAAATILGAKLIVPIHYGVHGAEGYSELPNPEAALLDAASRRGVDVEVVKPGEWLSWNGKKKGSNQ